MKWDHLAIVLLKFFQTLSPRALRAASRCLGNLEACQAQLPASFGLRYCSNPLETHLIEIHVGQGRAAAAEARKGISLASVGARCRAVPWTFHPHPQCLPGTASCQILALVHLSFLLVPSL